MKKIMTAIALAGLAAAANASSIQIQTGSYTGPGLFSDPSFYQTVVEAAVGAPRWAGSYDNLTVPMNDGALASTVVFAAATGGDDWTFRAGVDFGKGGAIYLDGVLQQSFSNNMWWNGSYTVPGQYFQFTANDLAAGTHVLTLYGLEDCCSGNEQAQFRIGDGAFVSFDNHDGLQPVPEAPGAALLLAGLALVGTLAGRRPRA